MGVLDRLLRGSGFSDRNRKTTPSRPSVASRNPLHNQITTPVRPASGAHPAVPVRTKPSAPASPVAASRQPTPADTEIGKASAFEPALQKKLDRYFERLRAVYPGGVITRLNTGQKKLAERGAKLRRLCGMENELDAFFALGGLTYERTAGGRPRNIQTAHAREALINEIRALFPTGVSSAALLDRADHALYLRLRSAARLSGTTITAFLNEYELNTKGDKAV